MTQLGLVLVSVAGEAATNAANPAPPSEIVPWPAHLAGEVAWPIAALVIALIFWGPLSELVRSGRITKFSIFNVGIELTPATSAPETQLLNEVRDASVTYIGDSSKALLAQVQSDKPADYAVIDLGTGEEWLTSRLYVATIMLSRMNGAQVLVFVETAGTTRRRFVAVASIRHLRWALARSYPWLEKAWLSAVSGAFPTTDLMTPVVTSDVGGFEPQKAMQITNAYLQLLQMYPQPAAMPTKARSRAAPNPPPPVRPPPGWVRFDDGRQEHAEWVTHQLLTTLIPAGAFQAWAPAMTDEPRPKRIRAVLRRAGDFTALVDDDRNFIRLVNRRTLIDEIAAAAGDEPEKASR